MQFWGRRGSAVHIVAGKLYLAEAPRWLADTVIRERHLLQEGSVYLLQETGWVVLHTLTSTQMHHADNRITPQPVLGRIWASIITGLGFSPTVLHGKP